MVLSLCSVLSASRVAAKWSVVARCTLQQDQVTQTQVSLVGSSSWLL